MGRLDDLLERLAARALVVVARSGRDPSLAPFVGPAKLAASFVVAPRGASPRLGYFTPMERGEAAATGLPLLTPEALDLPRWSREPAGPAEVLANVLARAFHLCEVPPGKVALAGLVDAGRMVEAARRLAADGWELVEGEMVMALLRKRKSPAEQAEARRVAAATAAAFRRVAALLAAADVDPARHATAGELWLGGERLRVRRLLAEVARVLAEHRLEQPEGGICAPAEEGAVPHTAGTPDRVLRAGESLVLDLYPRGLSFADCTRTFCVGEAPPALRAAHERVLAALELARREARPGRRGWDLQERVAASFAAAGYPTQLSDPSSPRGYVHGLGHGVGYEVQELPSFRRHADAEEGLLEEGDVFTLEPGLYDPAAGWAVRLEDLHLLGPEGIEVLTPLPYALDPRAWT